MAMSSLDGWDSGGRPAVCCHTSINSYTIIVSIYEEYTSLQRNKQRKFLKIDQ